MISHSDIEEKLLRKEIRKGTVRWAGNQKLQIYGTLKCASGKRMKRTNRVFFSTDKEAIQNGYRPCGHCLRAEYKKWKNGFIQ